ncbi:MULTISPECIES: alpha/beta hydrolase [Dyadobacter]|uniref:Alpha/beta hydrolase n=1 Tax=Dyadobacter chenhuakuii TaxID=2909339 RepID=A0A9X1TWN8_9BACT|nr:MULTISPECIES: alpha/beta hydrolase [Dyadobacter]MCF2501292.1 alpha/beta hydrolase [Dyadobacter chenhuakuii]MCF2502129.1 alpha/beta hydrolase [Dyadobacter fanqingshengii]
MKNLKRLGSIALAIIAMINSNSTIAQDLSDGADNFYKSDKVTIKKITFKNQYNMKVAGNLFVPKNLDQTEKNAAIIVGHPMGAVKEQSANLYATKMAEKGFVTLSLDLSFWGESQGSRAMRSRPTFMQKISVLRWITWVHRRLWTASGSVYWGFAGAAVL